MPRSSPKSIPPSPSSTEPGLLRRLAQLERAARPLEPGAVQRRAVRGAVVASTERFLSQLEELKAFNASAGTGEGLLASPIAETGLPIEEVLHLVEDEVVRPRGNPASGGYLAYVPGGGLYPSALGDYMAAISNKFAALFFTGPGAVRMENQLLRWVADLVGYPAGAAGNLASGGSIATLVAVVTARQAHSLKGADFHRAVVYLTAQAHHCIEKALRLAGLDEAVVREIPTDERYRLRPDALAAAIAEDRAAGLRPWLVVATAGTTDTGAVDPLDAVAGVAKREGCWYHVDAAYGGFFLLTEEGRARFAGIERSDSVVLDPHKSLFLPYGTGVVLVKDPRPLLATHHYTASYLQDSERAPDAVSPADVSPELTKHFRALRMWLPLKLLGVAPFRAALEEKLLLARYFRDRAAALGFEVGPEPELSIVTYRWAPAGASPEEADELNRRIAEHVRNDGRIFLSTTQIEGRFTLRLIALSFRTHRRHIDLALKVLAEAVAALG